MLLALELRRALLQLLSPEWPLRSRYTVQGRTEVNEGKSSDGVDLLAEPLAWFPWATWW